MNMHLLVREQKTEYISLLRAFAIFSVVCAHVTDSNSNLLNLIFSSIGTYGVGVFFILSGYFFFLDQRSPYEFAKRKCISIIIPWLFCGTLDWLYVVVRKGGLSLVKWALSVLVYSHYYYLTVLLIFYVLMWKLRRNSKICTVLCAVSLFSMWLTGKGILDVYPYINPLNWLFYFIIGIEFSRSNCLERISQLAKKMLFCLVPFMFFSMSWVIYEGKAVSYWYHGTVVSISLMILTVLGWCRYLCDDISSQSRVIRVFIWIGRYSFPIYLLHMPFAGVVKHITDILNNWFIQLGMPFVVLGIVSAIIYMISKIPFHPKIKSVIKLLLGIRV